MRNGSDSGWCGRPKFQRPRRCSSTGTTASSTMSASLALALAVSLHLYEAVEPHMGTLVSIKLYAADETQARVAFRAAFDRIAQIDAALSDYLPDSELNRIG